MGSERVRDSSTTTPQTLHRSAQKGRMEPQGTCLGSSAPSIRRRGFLATACPPRLAGALRLALPASRRMERGLTAKRRRGRGASCLYPGQSVDRAQRPTVNGLLARGAWRRQCQRQQPHTKHPTHHPTGTNAFSGRLEALLRIPEALTRLISARAGCGKPSQHAACGSGGLQRCGGEKMCTGGARARRQDGEN